MTTKVFAALGTELIQFFAALAILLKEDYKNTVG